MNANEPEHWLRGPVAGYAAELQPVVHSLQQAMEDVESLVAQATAEELWCRPGGAASAGFHLVHMANSLDRLMTYARGELLSEAQRRTAAEEKDPRPLSPEEVLEHVRSAIEAALAQLRDTPESSLDEPREVGRKRLPATVRGTLHHAAEHTTRHVGQAISTLRIVRGMDVTAACD